MALFQLSEPGQVLPAKKLKRAAGIDLGTTHSMIATVVESELTLLPVEDGFHLLPSVVHYSADEVTVGRTAIAATADDPQNVLASFKRWMGRSAEEVMEQSASSQSYQFVSDRGLAAVRTAAGPVTAVHASAEILRYLKGVAEEVLDETLEGFVITVPAYFDEAQRQATKDAADMAGLNVLRLISEPTAAALAYGLDKKEGQRILIYDLGGGTFDVSLLQLNRGIFEVLATAGDAALGGDDFDELIVQWVLNQSESSTASVIDRRCLLNDARTAKENLTTVEQAIIPYQGKQYTLSRQVLNELVRPLIEKTVGILHACLRDAGVLIHEVDELVLVGGSTRMPFVSDSLRSVFGKTPKGDIDPDSVVAMGAALQADRLIGNPQGEELLLLDVTPLSLGVETMGGLVEKVIQRNSPIPVSRSQEFTTYKDGQTAISIHVVQGEREMVADCRSLARFELRGIPAMVAGAARVRVTFTVDADGLLAVSAEEVSTGVKASVDVKPSYGLDETRIAEMLTDSYSEAMQDKERRVLAEAKLDAQRLLDALASAMSIDAKKLLSDLEQDRLKKEIKELQSVLNSDDAQIILEKTKRLSVVSEAFAARRMNNSIQQALQGKHFGQLEDDI